MQPINDTTYQVENTEELAVKVGDEKQDEALPRVKLEAWQNEANLSVGVIHDETTDHTMELQEDKLVWQQGDTTARFYNLNPAELKQDKIEFINEGECTAARIAATYEVDRYHIWENQTIRLHWADKLSMLYYGFYPASKFIDPNKIDIPEVRMAAANWNDPMTMDNGLPLICIHYNGDRDNLEKLHNSMVQAITEVLSNYGIEVLTSDNPYKLYFQDGDRKVKFFSTAYIDGNYYFYINLDHDYNQALNYYKNTDAKPRNDQHAHGLKTIKPDLPDSVLVEIIEKYAQLYGLPLVERTYTQEEENTIAKIQNAHTDDWVQNGIRDDVWRLNALEQLEKGLEFDITLDSKPDNNIYPLSITTKNLSFYKQGEVELGRETTDYISPKVVNSYAVYHIDKDNSKYKTGKAFHIYRPIIIDANGYEVWGDMEIDTDNDLLNIIIPQDFIDTATYPITIDPTFGYTTVGASSTTLADIIVASDISITSNANIVAGLYYQNSSSAAGSFNQAIYDNAGNLLYTGVQRTNSVQSWVYNNFSAIPTIAAGTYRLAAWANDGAGYGDASIAYDTTTGTSYSYSLAYSGTFPTDMSSFTTETSRRYSIYAFGGYQYPINVGNSTAMAATARYQPIDTGNATAWSTTSQAQSVVFPAETYLTNLSFQLGTAPGVGTSRAMSVYNGTGSTNLVATISDTATTASDNVDAGRFIAGNLGQIANVPTGTPASSSNNKWRMAYTYDYQFWQATSIAALSTTATRYLGVQDQGGVDTGTAAATSTMPNDTGVLQNFICRLTDQTLSAGSYTVTLVKNGVDTAAVMTITSNQATYTATTISVTNGDTLYWKIVPSTPTAPNIAARISIACEYASNTAGNGVIFGGDNANVSGTTYSSSFDVWNATEANINALCYQHTITGLRVDLSAAPTSTNTRTITTRKNASGTAAAITITGAATTGSWSGTLSIANDDLLAFEHTSTGTPTASNMKYAYVFQTPAITAPVTGYYRLPIMGVG